VGLNLSKAGHLSDQEEDRSTLQKTDPRETDIDNINWTKLV